MLVSKETVERHRWGKATVKFDIKHNFSALLTRKLPNLLSRLKDTSGGSENILLVSGSFCRILIFLRMSFFTVRLCGS